MNPVLRIAVSSCLLGNKVRFDGTDKQLDCLQLFDGAAELVPVCPEVELGLSTPRPPMQLIPGDHQPRIVVIESGQDHTDAMRALARRRVGALNVDGWIFKSKSPSCGIRSAPISGMSSRGSGVFAGSLNEIAPNAVICEGRDIAHLGGFYRFVAKTVDGALARSDRNPAKLEEVRALLYGRAQEWFAQKAS